jgi:signal transduction histidine kinase
MLLDGILRNLARNALDHTLPGGRVFVGCRRRGATVRIEVHDTGEGIPPDRLKCIFEPFFRLDATRSEGLGLGLFIVRRAADYLVLRFRNNGSMASCCIIDFVMPGGRLARD